MIYEIIHYSETDRKNFRYNHIVSQPDSVMSQLNHLLVLEYKSIGGRKHETNKWQHQIRLKDILQTIINSLQVSLVMKKTAVPLLRYPNAIYFIQPSKELCDFILDNALAAKKYFNEQKYVSSSELSEYIEPLIKRKYPFQHENVSVGKEMHEKMLKK